MLQICKFVRRSVPDENKTMYYFESRGFKRKRREEKYTRNKEIPSSDTNDYHLHTVRSIFLPYVSLGELRATILPQYRQERNARNRTIAWKHRDETRKKEDRTVGRAKEVKQGGETDIDRDMNDASQA